MAQPAAAAGKSRTALEEMGTTGEFVRKASVFRDIIQEGGRFTPEANRYHLYIAFGCPWATRCLATLYLKGLEDVIGVSITHATWQRTKPDDPNDQHTGWVFRNPEDPPIKSPTGHGSFECDGCIPDSVNGAKTIRELYELAKDTNGKYTVPVLWDKKEKTIVNNESADIVRMFNSAFNHVAKNASLDLYPEALRAKIDEVNDWVYPTINNGVYRCGFATTQQAYDTAFKELFESLDRCEQILDKQRYIAGDQLTEADIRLFKTLIRFDEVYVVYFKTNKRNLREYPNIKNYVAEIYQLPGMSKAVNMKHIKMHYYTSHPTLNHYAIIPGGAQHAWWEEPHDRERLPAKNA